VLDKALTVAAAKAKMAGLVVAAAAIGGTAVTAGSTAFVPTAGDDTVTATASDSPSPEATVEPTVEPTADPAPEATLDAAPPAAPVVCPTDLPNHGAYVSSVAKDHTVTGREHGKAVSEAAKSDCGKSGEDAADAEETEAPEVEATEAPDSEDGSEATADTRKTEKHGHGKKSR
jgi:hypothetical protein